MEFIIWVPLKTSNGRYFTAFMDHEKVKNTTKAK